MAEPDYRAYAKTGMGALHQWYNSSTGQWRTTGWWNAANALTAVVAYTKITGDTTYESVIGTTFAAAQRQHANFINDYYDDNGWWALAWIAAFDLTRNTRYLQAAKTIFTHNTGGWDDTCGGGLWWNTAKTYKNAITNELFLALAAQLHLRTPGDSGYLTWAKRAWDWFSASGLIGTTGLINDGLSSACQNNGGPTWTYNQGVILGGLGALSESTGDRAYLEQGEIIADVALRTLITTPTTGPQSGQAILTESCEAGFGDCSGDQVQFKGIFMRNLHDLSQRTNQPNYQAFILANASSIWDNNKNAANEFGVRWTGPFDQADAGRQSSALDSLIAAAAVAG
jgi:predicted alpha-1,6-mannanase (GH76 family)